ncbi:hypothetical protein P3T73_06470 [Kiritimatiellota bacterium B12222]|nr:hypothetical protein P3T73_06470 [Kiritimatiellota bacterium B12222]
MSHRPRTQAYRIGELAFRLEVVGNDQGLFRSWVHNEVSRDASFSEGMALYVWDAQSTSSGYPELPWSANDHVGRGEIQGGDDPEVSITFCPGARVLVMIDFKHAEAWYWTPDFSRLPFYERAAPGRFFLSQLLRTQGALMVHGAAVAVNEECGLLLAGPGGSGKSCTSISGLRDPLKFLGDDYTGLSVGPAPVLHSLYASAKVYPDQVERLNLSGVSLTETNEDEGKSVLYLHPEFQHSLLKSSKLKAVVIPQVTGGNQSEFEPLSKIKTLRALAPSSLFQLPFSGVADFSALSQVIKTYPTYRLRLGVDPQEIQDVIYAFLQAEGGES